MKPVQTSVILCILLANACSIRANPIKDKFLQAIGYFYPEPSKGYEKLSNEMKPGEYIHKNCRDGKYPESDIKRAQIVDKNGKKPDGFVTWDLALSKDMSYSPDYYESSILLTKDYCDPLLGDPSFAPKWNEEDQTKDGKIDRRSHHGAYQVHDGYPLNPFGPTGLRGRGKLPRFGVNHAVDPMFARWKRDKKGEQVKHPKTGKFILEMVFVQRKDDSMWALPGGKVDPNETPLDAVLREFTEEALGEVPDSQIAEFFKVSVEIFKGYVDDKRNTDNAWMETIAYLFHDSDGKLATSLKLKPGKGEKSVAFKEVNGSLKLFANHIRMVHDAVVHLNAHW